jgi:glycosyltransferase involved in cell wall biosynthesis
MRLAFYAPLKAPDHPTPSGDRQVARNLQRALAAAGYSVAIASELRMWEGRGESTRQAALEAQAAAELERLTRGWSDPDSRPALWFTYHLYHKAPDLIGPAVADRLAIPYVVAEASYAAKRASGPWGRWNELAARAIGRADLILHLNRSDASGVAPLCRPAARTAYLAPFLDPAPYTAAALARDAHRAALAARYGLDSRQTWLLAVAMMRQGDKLASYRLLAEALGSQSGARWQLLVVGDGASRREVEAGFAAFGARVRFAGALAPDALEPCYAACDVMVWPAINEAYGMALLEAQAAGLPVLAGRTGGVPDIIEDGVTGRLVPVGKAAAFAAELACLLDAPPERLRQMRAAALARVARVHSLQAATATLSSAIGPLVRQ